MTGYRRIEADASLAEAESEFKDEKTVLENLVRRKQWARDVRE